MEMVIKIEPAFTWFYSCNKTLHGQCPPVLPALDVGHSLCPPVEGHCYILNSLAKKVLIIIGFVTSKNHHYFPCFPPSFLPALSFLFFLIQLLKIAFHLQLLQSTGYIPHVAQYILELILHLRHCTSNSSNSVLPLPLSTPRW